MVLPVMYATIAYVDRNTRWDDVEFYVSRRYTADSMWGYVKRAHERARLASSVRLLDITVLDEDGQEVWSWRP